MCGIAGIVTPDIQGHRVPLERMIAALRHRGPDGQGVLAMDGCVLGHARLSIIDLAGGHQPMRAVSHPLAVTFNGEIYDYKALKEKLVDYPFQTNSDTEVLLALYVRYREKMLSHLPGMFAFSIWDESQKTLFAARDRFGEKPFFYAWSKNGQFVFSSELNALLASGLIEPKIDRSALSHYFQRGCIYPHRTIYNNVFSLPPSHFLILKEGKLQIESYWKPPRQNDAISTQDAIEEFRHLFGQAVERQMVADVPVGIFLSGGLDSSSIVAAAKHHSNLKLKTMAFNFAQSGVNELPFARDVARMHDTEHIEVTDSRLNIDVPEMLDTMSRVYDQPYGDSANIPTYLICREARRHVTVVLSGDGGDELLAGYKWLYHPLWRMAHTPAFLSRLEGGLRIADRAMSKFPDLIGQHELVRHWMHGAHLRHLHGKLSRAHQEVLSRITREDLESLGFGDCAHGDYYSGNSCEGNAIEPDNYSESSINGVLNEDSLNFLPGLILQKTDRASMAHGLEVRAPFLDIDFATFCMSLPDRLKMTEQEDKWILRRAYENDWPASVRTRSKWGFGSPFKAWLTQPDMVDLKSRLLGNPNSHVFNYVSFEGSQHLVDGDNYPTWSLLCLALWMEKNPY